VSSPPRENFDHTLSRREMRALREQAGRASEPEPSPGTDVEPANELVIEPAVELMGGELVGKPAVVLVIEPEVELVVDANRLPSVSSAPTGSHWSAGINDAHDPFENTFSRDVGSAVSLSNTNALVLPEMPNMNLAGPAWSTGEIIITGMIDLPRSVASTGAVPARHESPDIDDLLELGDFDSTPPNSAPVSALTAVSSHTGTHSLLTPSKRPSSGVVATVLIAATVVMAVVAIGLFVVAAVNGLF